MGYAASAVKTRRVMADVPQHVIGDQRGQWLVVVPEESTNMIVNPSMELGFVGYTNNGASLLKTTTSKAAVGASSLQAITATANTGWYFDVTSITAIDTYYTLSMWVSGLGSVYVYVYGSAGGGVYRTLQGLYLTDTWVRVTLLASWATGDTTRLVGMSQSGAVGTTMYMDGMQLEAKLYPTTYIDGDQEGCFWRGTPHSSESYRLATTRKGGRVWNLKDWKFSIAEVIGTAAPPLTTVVTPYALTGGGHYQRSISPSRSFSIVGGFECDSDIDLRRNRNQLISALSPFTIEPQQPVRLFYEPTDCADAVGPRVSIDAIYTGGLEGAQSNDVGRENAALNFQVVHPFGMLAQSEITKTAPFESDVLHSSAYFQHRRLTNGLYRPLSDASINNFVLCAAIETPTRYYMGGLFSTPYSGVVRVDLLSDAAPTFNSLGGGADAVVRTLAIGPDGYLYAGGDFGTIGGVASVNRLARWNGSVWASVGGGANGSIYAAAFASTGSLVIAGSFSSVNAGATAAAAVAAYNLAGSWSALATSITGVLYNLAIGKGDTVYVGGLFSAIQLANSISAGSVAALNPVTGFYDDMLGGVSGGSEFVLALLVAKDSRLYVGGGFNTAGGITVNNIAVWNGSSWAALGTGVSGGMVSDITQLDTGELLVVGDFTSAGGITCDGAAIWTGSSWALYDFRQEPGETVEVAVNKHSLLVLAGSFATQTVPEPISVTVGGSSTVAPVIVLRGGTGSVSDPRMLYNWTTNKRIYFNFTLLPGEVVTLRLGDVPSFTSSARGDILNTILPGSDLTTFRLIPGVNILSLDLYNVAAGSIYWREGHSTLDSVFV